ncbi:unnamed protein product [Gadus morhua 'NCC']
MRVPSSTIDRPPAVSKPGSRTLSLDSKMKDTGETKDHQLTVALRIRPLSEAEHEDAATVVAHRLDEQVAWPRPGLSMSQFKRLMNRAEVFLETCAPGCCLSVMTTGVWAEEEGGAQPSQLLPCEMAKRVTPAALTRARRGVG